MSIRIEPTQKVLTGTDPAANVEISETVPAGKWWKLLGVVATLVTDAGVANRSVVFTLDDGTTEYWRSKAGGNQTASQTSVYQLAVDQVDDISAPNVKQILNLQDLFVLGSGYRIKTITANRQATDNWGAPKLFVIEYSDYPAHLY